MIWSPATLTRRTPEMISEPPPHTYSFSVSDGEVEVRLTVWLDAAEHLSRQQRRIPALVKESTLSALLSVADGELSRVERRFEAALRYASTKNLTDLVEAPDGSLWASSRVGPPLEILGIEAVASSWRKAFAVINEWAGYGPRYVHLPNEREIDALTLSEASMRGLGVTVGPSKTVAIKPVTFISTYWSSARWQVLELLYDNLLKTQLIDQ